MVNKGEIKKRLASLEEAMGYDVDWVISGRDKKQFDMMLEDAIRQDEEIRKDAALHRAFLSRIMLFKDPSEMLVSYTMLKGWEEELRDKTLEEAQELLGQWVRGDMTEEQGDRIYKKGILVRNEIYGEYLIKEKGYAPELVKEILSGWDWVGEELREGLVSEKPKGGENN